MTPTTFLADFSRRYQPLWRAADDLRSREAGTGRIPAWCFLPSSGAHLLIYEHTGVRPTPERLDLAQDAGTLAMLAAWRVSQGIYRFEPEIFGALIDTPDTGTLPVDVLYRLPEWALFIETPGLTVAGRAVSGFFVRLDDDDGMALCLLWLPVDDGPCTPMMLRVREGESLTQALDRSFSIARAATGVDVGIVFAETLAGLRLALPLILYLCSASPDVASSTGGQWQAGYAAPKKIKTGWRLFPPDKPTIWHVGESIAREIRVAATGERTGPHAGPRPHIRRAHWHGFWSGTLKPKEGVEPIPRRFDLKWLPPMPVAMGEDDDG